MLQRSGAAIAGLGTLEKNADNETGGKSRTDANLINLRTGTDQKGMATSTRWGAERNYETAEVSRQAKIEIIQCSSNVKLASKDNTKNQAVAHQPHGPLATV